LILWARLPATNTRASVPAAALSLVGSLVWCLLSYVEHVRSVRPSFLLNVYLLFSLLFDIACARTLWLQPYNRTLAIVYTASVALKSLILLLEAIEKRRILRPPYKSYPPEAVAGIYNRSFFWWLNSLFRRGFSKALFVPDLFTLDKHLVAQYLENLLQSAWNKGSLSSKLISSVLLRMGANRKHRL